MASLQYHLQKALGTGIRNPVQKPTILDEFGNKLQNPIHNDESNEANSEYLTGIDNRFSRQEIISGWNQQALLNRRIAVIGTGAIANYFAPSLSVLGAGHIFILGNENGKGGRNEFMHSLKKSPYSSSSKSLEWLIREEINPSSYVEIRGLNCDYRSIGISSFDVVIDATNEPKSKEECRRYCENSKKTFISASSDSTFSYAEIYNPNAPNKSQKAVKGSSGFYEHFRGKEQGAVTSGVAAGLALDFLRKDAFMIKGDPEKRAFHRILYSRGDESRFFYDEGCENALSLGLSPEPESIDKKILIAGAGAIGNFAALELALLGVKNIDIVDFDRVELANANRQILICDPYSIGKSAKKAEVLSEKIRRINPRINSRGIYGRIGESGHFQKFLSSNFGISCSNEEMRAISRDFIKKGGYEMILGCVDNPMARAYLNICAVELGIPYLDGGTEPFASAVRAYIPGKTACINCQMGLENMAKEWAKRKMERNSCESEEKEPSVVISNMIAGSILAGEASLMLESGKAAKKSINYDSSADYELYTAFITSPISSCKCNMKDLRKI